VANDMDAFIGLLNEKGFGDLEGQASEIMQQIQDFIDRTRLDPPRDAQGKIIDRKY
jgi:hypothetical protein